MARLLLLTNSERNYRRVRQLVDTGRLPHVWFIREFYQHPNPTDGPHWTAVPDLEDEPALLAALDRATARAGTPYHVVALDEFGVLPAAMLRARLGLPGPRRAAVLPLRDKELMHRKAATAGLRTTLQLSANAVANWDFRTPLVAKPRSQAASIGVRKISSAAELARMPAGLVYEEWLDAEVCHVDGVVAGGRIEFAVCARYLGTCYEFATGAAMGGITITEPEVRARLLHAAGDIVSGLSIPDGAFHVELFDAPDGPVLLEAAARPPGALLQAMDRAATGVDLLAEHIRIGMGEPVTTRRTRRDVAGFWRLPQLPDTSASQRIRAVPALPDLHSEVVDAMLPQPGQLASGQPNPSEPLAAVLLRGREPGAVLADLMTLRERMRVEVDPAVIVS